MNTKNKNNSLFQKDQLKASLKQSFVKLNPRLMVKNPIMFTVEIATFFMLPVTVYSAVSDAQGSVIYNFSVFVILFLTLLFANFAEAIAEARGKAQADSLRKTREETPAKRVTGGKLESVSSSQLKKGDVFECEAGDVIPADGEIIEGLASIDESAITGESAPVIREAGGDKSSVTGGTKVLSDRIRVVVTTQPGESFLDKMIALVEGASRLPHRGRTSSGWHRTEDPIGSGACRSCNEPVAAYRPIRHPNSSPSKIGNRWVSANDSPLHHRFLRHCHSSTDTRNQSSHSRYSETGNRHST